MKLIIEASEPFSLPGRSGTVRDAFVFLDHAAEWEGGQHLFRVCEFPSKTTEQEDGLGRARAFAIVLLSAFQKFGIALDVEER